jgi:hypothetical protein
VKSVDATDPVAFWQPPTSESIITPSQISNATRRQAAEVEQASEESPEVKGDIHP